MSPVDRFEFVLVLIASILAMELIARRLRAPPAAALILGGLVLALLPGMPRIAIDPELLLTLFLPPLLMAGGYTTAWREFRRHLSGILLLAVGATVFTTVVVAIAVHLVLPSLPWAACAALGAVVSPSDAVAAAAVLARVRLPRRTVALLEGESLLNDAAAIVLFRFAVAAAVTGRFNPMTAGGTFLMLLAVGIAVGALVGYLGLVLIRRVLQPELIIPISLLFPYAAYIGGERLGGSGVIAAVVAGLVIGWHQHEVQHASGRRSMTTVWMIFTSLLEAFVFVLIGLSLRTVETDLGGAGAILHRFGVPVLVVVATVIVSRFVWVLASDALGRLRFGADGRPSLSAALVLGWVGMRGVVTLAIALSLPQDMPGRDLILVSAFAVIFVTVLGQGSTLGFVIRRLGVGADQAEQGTMTHLEALAASAEAQREVVARLAHDADGTLIHPRLLEQFNYRAELMRDLAGRTDFDASGRDAHYTVVIEAVAAGRREVIRLHRLGRLADDTLQQIEHDLDLQEIAARRVIDTRPS